MYAIDSSGTIPQFMLNNPPCFRSISPPAPGLFGAKIKLANGGSLDVDLPVFMTLGVPPSRGVEQLWGRTLAYYLGRSLGVSSANLRNDPNTPGAQFVQGYGSWEGLSYAPVAPGAQRLSPAGEPEPILPDFSLGEQDQDGDGVPENDDTCPGFANADQSDLDADGLGTACDADADGDGLRDEDEDNPGDTDNDGTPNEADDDDDGDGAADGADNCPLLANADQANLDGDEAGDACDADRDGDGLPDYFEETVGTDPDDPVGTPEFLGNEDSCSDSEDNDGDGDTDAADQGCLDGDGDTVPDSVDNCPNLSVRNVLDSDNDGTGDQCEPPGTERTWGDVNCNGALNIGDSIALARSTIGLDPGLEEGCPEIGTLVDAGGTEVAWGNVDCGAGAPNIGDAIVVARHLIGITPNVPGCPALGSVVSVSEA
jgi:hypothetical protein